jgi:L,D-transpeptidase ErfK/SrfK
MREEKPFLPTAVPQGPSNPLGTHALYLGWPTFLIHGSNKPWGIGRRVSSGCMRMYPEDIIDLFNKVPVGTKVTVVDQPILVGWVGDDLYLEANPTKTQSLEIEISGEHTVEKMDDKTKDVIAAAAGPEAEGKIDWSLVEKVLEERSGYPVLIGSKNAPVQKQPRREKPRYN